MRQGRAVGGGQWTNAITTTASMNFYGCFLLNLSFRLLYSLRCYDMAFLFVFVHYLVILYILFPPLLFTRLLLSRTSTPPPSSLFLFLVMPFNHFLSTPLFLLFSFELELDIYIHPLSRPFPFLTVPLTAYRVDITYQCVHPSAKGNK